MAAINVKDLRKLAPDFPIKELTELGVYAVKANSSDITYAAATTGVTLFELPQGANNVTNDGFLVIGFGFRATQAWSTLRPVVQLGTSTDADKFGTLSGADLNQVGRRGVLWCFEEMVSSDYASTGFNVIATFDHGDATVTTGTMDIWMFFKPGLNQSYFVRP